MADAKDLKSFGLILRAGSSPASGTNINELEHRIVFEFFVFSDKSGTVPDRMTV